MDNTIATEENFKTALDSVASYFETQGIYWMHVFGNYVIPVYGSTGDEVKFAVWGIDSNGYLSAEEAVKKFRGFLYYSLIEILILPCKKCRDLCPHSPPPSFGRSPLPEGA